MGGGDELLVTCTAEVLSACVGGRLMPKALGCLMPGQSIRGTTGRAECMRGTAPLPISAPLASTDLVGRQVCIASFVLQNSGREGEKIGAVCLQAEELLVDGVRLADDDNSRGDLPPVGVCDRKIQAAQPRYNWLREVDQHSDSSGGQSSRIFHGDNHRRVRGVCSGVRARVSNGRRQGLLWKVAISDDEVPVLSDKR